MLKRFAFLACTLFVSFTIASADSKSVKTRFCEDLPTPETGSCTVTTGNTALLLKGTVLGVDTVFQGGEVLIGSSGLIQYVGCSSNRPPELADLASSATKIICAKGVISPGLINTHDHLSFDQNSPFPATTTRFQHRNDWRPIVSVNDDNSQSRITWSELRQLMAGTTSSAGSAGVPGFLRNLDLQSFPLFDDLLWNTIAGEQ